MTIVNMNDFLKRWIKWYAWILPIIFNIYLEWETSLNNYLYETTKDIINNYILLIPMFVIYKIYKNLENETI